MQFLTINKSLLILHWIDKFFLCFLGVRQAVKYHDIQ